MPRSVNSVAAKQEEKVLKLAKGYFGRRKMFILLQKMLLIKGFSTHTEIEDKRREILELCDTKNQRRC